MQMGSTNEHFTTLGDNSRVMASRTDAPCRLAVLQLTEDGPGQESISLRADSDLTIFVLTKRPDERLLVDDLLGYDTNIVVFTLVHSVRVCGAWPADAPASPISSLAVALAVRSM